MRKGITRGILGITAAASVALVAAGCGTTTATTTSTTPDTLHLVQQTDVPTLDPAQWSDSVSMVYMHAIYDTLVQYVPDGTTFAPDLATSWTVSPDGKTYTFFLRKGVKFSNGDPFNAAAVQYNLNRLTAKAAQAPYAGSYADIVGYSTWHNGQGSGLSGVQVVNPYEITIHLTTPAGYFLNTMALMAAAIGDPKVEAKYGYKNYLDHAVGTGPYELVKWTHNREIDLKANPTYWGSPKPSIKYINTAIGPSDNQQYLMFQKGQLDFYGGQGGNVSSAAYLKIVANAQMKKLYHLAPAVSTWYTGFNVTQAPFNNVTVRQAVNYAVDKNQLVQALTNGRGSVDNDALFTPGLPGYSKTATLEYAYNPTKAAQMLASVGITPSHPVSTILATVNTPDGIRQADIVQANLKPLGINVSVKSMSWGPFLQYTSSQKNNYGLYNLGWIEDYPDPQDFFYNLFDASQNNGGTNSTGWTDSRFESLITRADNMPSTQNAERIALYQQANQILFQQAPWVWEYYGYNDVLVQPWVHYQNLGNIGLGPIYPIEFNYLTLSAH